jgi:F-type H+-transporting ATPase subunit delta
MKDLQTIARPYAKALFELALKHHALVFWDNALTVSASAIEDVEMQKLLAHPSVRQEMLVEILTEILDKNEHSELIQSALQVMAKHQRLAVLPEVARQYQALKAEYEKSAVGTVFTSIKLDDDQLQRLETGLKKKLNKTVHLTQVVEPSLLGGARVQIGDMVIDGTLRGRIQRLSQALSA